MTKNSYQSPPIGQETSLVLRGIDEKKLLDNLYLGSVLRGALLNEHFTILGEVEKSFDPQGYTALYLLSESHLAVHTYPEYNALYFNMYSCRGPKDTERTIEHVLQELNPSEIRVIAKGEVPLDVITNEFLSIS